MDPDTDLSPVDVVEYLHQDGEEIIVDDYVTTAEQQPQPSYTPHRPKIIAILKNLHCTEVKIYSVASREFINLLRGELGKEILREYVQLSPKCSELSETWKLHHGKPGMAHILALISEILDHPDGKLLSGGIKSNLDCFAQSVIETKLDDIYVELKSAESRRQSAALSVLGSVVRRGMGLASEVTKKFDFKLPVFTKLAGVERKKEKEKDSGEKRSTRLRRAFVRFALSFLEVGNPRLLRWVLQQRGMYSGVLQRLGSDDEETVVYVLSMLRDKVLVESSLIPPSLRSVLFGSVTLEQLCFISGNVNAGDTADVAYEVLIRVCTDPQNGLMPGQNLKGNEKRLVDFMMKLKATEVRYHRDLLLAIMKGRPLFCSKYMDEFPYNLEPRSSSLWFAAISLAADLVSSINADAAIKTLSSYSLNVPALNSDEVQNVLKCIIPSAFARTVINRGLLHKDTLVKHGSLRLLLESVKALGNLTKAIDIVVEKLSAKKTADMADGEMTSLGGLPGFDCFTSVDRCLNAERSGSSLTDEPEIQKWVSLKQYIQDEVRAVLPDSQVLLKLLSPSSHNSVKQSGLSLKRSSNTPDMLESSSKKLKLDTTSEDVDIVIAGVDAKLTDAMLEVWEKVRDTSTKKELGGEKDHTTTLAVIWGLNEQTRLTNEPSDAEKFFHAKLLDALTFYMQTMPAVFEGSFDFFKLLPLNPLSLSIDQQQSLLSLLVEYVGQPLGSRSSARAPELVYKHLKPIINLLIYSQVKEIQDQAYVLARAAMISTGAFDQNISEVNAWFHFLPGYNTKKCTLEIHGVEAFPDVILFLCDAVSTVGNNLYKYLDHMRKLISRLDNVEDASIDFSPLIICVLQKCLRLLESDSGAFKLHARSMITLYVCNTLSLILQTQVETKVLSGLIHLILAETLGDSSSTESEWRPLWNMSSLVQTVLDRQRSNLFFVSECSNTSSGSPFSLVIAEVEEFLKRSHGGGLNGVAIAFSTSIICASPGEIIVNFPLLLTVAQVHFRSHLSLLSSVFFLERDFLVKVSDLWPDMCFSGLEMPESKISLFFEHVSFYALFPAILTVGICESTRMLYTIHSNRILHLLQAKLSEGSFDGLFSNLRFVLFWSYELLLVYKAKPAVVLEELFQLCFSLVEYIFELLLPVTTTTDYVQAIVDNIFYHPLVTLAMSDPLCSGVILDKKSLSDCAEAFRNILPVHHQILQFLRKVFDCLLSLGNGQEAVLMASKHLGQKSLLLLKEEFERFVMKRDLGPLLHRFYILHASMHFVSPFELLEFVDSISASETGCLSAMSVVVYIADGALHMLYRYLKQPNLKSESHLFGERKDFDVSLLQKVYNKIIDFATSFDLECADICLLNVMRAVLHQRFARSVPVLLPLYMLLSRMVINSPIKLLLHCLHPMTKVKAKSLLLLTELNPLYMTLFGHIFLGIIENKIPLVDGLDVFGKLNGHDVPQDDLVLLLPAALSYLKSKQDLSLFETIPVFYSGILLEGFSDWKSYVCRSMFEEEYHESTPMSLDDLESLFSSSLLGKAIIMLCYFFSSSGRSMKEKQRSEIFNSVHPKSSVADELLDSDLKELNARSFKESLILINEVVAKINFTMLLLVPTNGEEGSKGITTERDSNRLNCRKLRFFNILVNTLDLIVRRFPLNIDCSVKSCAVRFLEYSILKNIVRLSVESRNYFVKLPSMPFMTLFIKSSLAHKFGDPITLKAIRCILVALSEGKFCSTEILELVVAHSQFVSTILLNETISTSSVFTSSGISLPSVPSILKSLDSSTHQNNSEGKNNNALDKRKLELIKLLRVLYYIKGRQQNTGLVNADGMNLRELLSLLLSGYTATLSETDLEMLLLMDEIELTKGSELIKKISDFGRGKVELINFLKVLYCIKRRKQSIGPEDACGMNLRDLLSLIFSGCGATVSEADLEMLLLTDESELTEGSIDYLWGSFALKYREEKALDRLETSKKLSDFGTIEERHKMLFRENIPVDSKLCVATVQNFCYFRSSRTDPLSLERLLQDTFMDTADKKQILNIDMGYDPVFVLRFSICSLLMGYIEPAEFSRLGLLAITFICMSSPEVGLRKLAYLSLTIFKNTLENHQNNKDKLLLQLLLTYLQNGITEPWQKIPSVTAIFAAEASFVLLNYSDDHFSTITRLLMPSPKENLKGFPLFSKLFGSGSILFNTDRLWILRLLYAGLNLEDDAEIYITEKLHEVLLNFCASSLSDHESMLLILKILKKSVKFPNLAVHLLQQCGLVPWLSSLVSFYGERLAGDEKYFSLKVLDLVLKVINDVISLKEIIEWLHDFALEQLSEFSSHLHSLFVGSLKSLRENIEVVNSMLHVMVSTLRISQKRKMGRPHFTLSLKGLFQLSQAISADLSNMELNHTMELGLNTILMSAPVPVISLMDRARLSKLLTWAISSALPPLYLTKEPDPALPISFKEGEESLVSKILRWAVASVILGSISGRFSKAMINFSSEISKMKTLKSLLESITNETGEKGGSASADEALAVSILHLQQISGSSCCLLPSVISALCLLLLPSGSNIAGNRFLKKNHDQIALFCSNIRCPAESDPAWRWSFDLPWEDRTVEQTEAEGMEELHACQNLLIIFSNALGGESEGLPGLSHLNAELSSLFEWERTTLLGRI